MLPESETNRRNYIIDILVICFGVSAWIEINGLWVETPVLVQRLPEGWKLTSFIVVLSQFGNVGPILYSFLKYFVKCKDLDYYAIHITLLIGSICCLMLSLFWNVTATIFGADHSIVLFVLTALLASVDCTTSVLYLPFMANFASKYFVSYLVGEGFSGLIPSIVSLLQGIQNTVTCENRTEVINGSTIDVKKAVYPEPRFSASVFFAILTAMMVLSWISFCILSWRKQENVVNSDITLQSNSSSNFDTNNEPLLQIRTFYFLLFLQTYVCALTNGVLPAIQSYSTLPYGSITFHLAVNLSVIANPVACFFAFFRKTFASVTVVCFIVTVGSMGTVYILTTALLSPKPPLLTVFGSSLIIFVWVTSIALFSFSKATIAAHLRNNSPEIKKSLFWYGVCTQLGSLCGALSTFVVVNFTNIFVALQPCS